MPKKTAYIVPHYKTQNSQDVIIYGQKPVINYRTIYALLTSKELKEEGGSHNQELFRERIGRTHLPSKRNQIPLLKRALLQDDYESAFSHISDLDFLSNGAGKDTFFGGRANRGESFEDCAIREFKEETGLQDSDIPRDLSSYLTPILSLPEGRNPQHQYYALDLSALKEGGGQYKALANKIKNVSLTQQRLNNFQGRLREVSSGNELLSFFREENHHINNYSPELELSSIRAKPKEAFNINKSSAYNNFSSKSIDERKIGGSLDELHNWLREIFDLPQAQEEQKRNFIEISMHRMFGREREVGSGEIQRGDGKFWIEWHTQAVSNLMQQMSLDEVTRGLSNLSGEQTKSSASTQDQEEEKGSSSSQVRQKKFSHRDTQEESKQQRTTSEQKKAHVPTAQEKKSVPKDRIPEQSQKRSQNKNSQQNKSDQAQAKLDSANNPNRVNLQKSRGQRARHNKNPTQETEGATKANIPDQNSLKPPSKSQAVSTRKNTSGKDKKHYQHKKKAGTKQSQSDVEAKQSQEQPANKSKNHSNKNRRQRTDSQQGFGGVEAVPSNNPKPKKASSSKLVKTDQTQSRG